MKTRKIDVTVETNKIVRELHWKVQTIEIPEDIEDKDISNYLEKNKEILEKLQDTSNSFDCIKDTVAIETKILNMWKTTI